jgi:hypothetical protein
VASDASGIAIGGAAAALANFPTWAGFVSQYVVGLAFGLVFFPMWFNPAARGVGFAPQLRASFLPRWFSMNAMMVGMIPLMMWFMSRDGTAMDARSLHFWAVMFVTIIVGGLVSYPVNLWLVANGLHPPVEDGCACAPEPALAAEQTPALY